MKRAFAIFFTAAIAAAAFTGGAWYTRHNFAPPKPEHKILYWVDPMHPAYKSDKPGIAPDCGMELEPVYADNVPTLSTLPAGTLDVSPEKQQVIGVTYATAELSSAAETIHAVGKVAVDETHITRVHPKIEGWISQVNVDFLGQVVKQGDALLTIYSPEMVATEQEFLLALRARDQMKSSPSREALENSEAMVNASRHRLERWEMSAAQIEELERTRTPVRSVTLYSPAAGYVTARNAFPSQKVAPETELYALADLSHAWILADVFETDLAKIQLGQSAWVSLASVNARGFSARVDFIQPQADPITRTVKVRLDAPNPDQRLKPDLFVNVEFRMGGASRVTVPSDAVVNTGTRQTVFVDKGNGQLEQRDIEMGDRIGDRTQILHGLKAGERVVASGTFLIDSEAQLKNGARQ
ncbi:MAG TPA: efflux RND transporter periplasmic adaptor subunit [Bryobacteraceae bacterium]|jgi:RND family efflux transporter MFP subunit